MRASVISLNYIAFPKYGSSSCRYYELSNLIHNTLLVNCCVIYNAHKSLRVNPGLHFYYHLNELVVRNIATSLGLEI